MKKILLLTTLITVSTILASEPNIGAANIDNVKNAENKSQNEKESRIKKIIEDSEAKVNDEDASKKAKNLSNDQKVNDGNIIEKDEIMKDRQKSQDNFQRGNNLNPSNNQSQDLDSLNEQMKVLIKSVNEIKESKTKFESVEKALLKNNKFIENNQETNDNATAPLAEIIDIDELNKYFLPDPIKLIKIGNTSFVYGEYKEKGYEVVNETLTEGFIPKTIRMKEGFTIGNWVLEEIDSDHVIYGNKKTKEKVIKYYDASKDGKKSIIIPSNGKGSKKDQVSVQKPAEQKDTQNPTNLKDKKIESKKQ